MPAMLLQLLQLVHELMRTMNSLPIRCSSSPYILAKCQDPPAEIEVAQARHATITAAAAVRARRLFPADWLRFLQAEIAARAALLALHRGFGEFRG
ncbi:hypothetical protein BGZ61DRAFT_527393 [Ilyonectria robusta]|uniref:uncharacterized protein n=1 Tax=Ilyonectria robusta TaxID=1079257 RepID=UPI001E8E873C|nr:uncharacterized protein BGZ61DRAFT_527393 [Ilyonectria robusta]KAH8736445.1 hypothetical protein BGZ61DRAFT_527393 [Ilyonectria robusta]